MNMNFGVMAGPDPVIRLMPVAHACSGVPIVGVWIVGSCPAMTCGLEVRSP